MAIRRGRNTGRRQALEYETWAGMIQRCENPKHNRYGLYGGRGISVCRRWRESFDAFIVDMGRRPSAKHSLERIDGNGNYEPGNVRWATPFEQSRNIRTNHWIEAIGERRTLADWAVHAGIKPATILARLDRGWPVEKAVTSPAGTRHLSTYKGNRLRSARGRFTPGVQ